MNFAKKIAFFALAATLFVSCKNTSKDGNIEEPNNDTVTDTTMTKETAANLETATFKIDGMVCAEGCAATIQNKLSHLDGVADAKVDFDAKKATVSFDPAKQNAESLTKTVEKAGMEEGQYKVSEMNVSKGAADQAVFDAKDEMKHEGCPDGMKGKACCKDMGKETAEIPSKEKM